MWWLTAFEAWFILVVIATLLLFIRGHNNGKW
jgi:hypothetical protein